MRTLHQSIKLAIANAKCGTIISKKATFDVFDLGPAVPAVVQRGCATLNEADAVATARHKFSGGRCAIVASEHIYRVTRIVG